MNECDTFNGGCEGTCDNEVGGYTCDCPEGQTLGINMLNCFGKHSNT